MDEDLGPLKIGPCYIQGIGYALLPEEGNTGE
jgi:hypothetical protein